MTTCPHGTTDPVVCPACFPEVYERARPQAEETARRPHAERAEDWPAEAWRDAVLDTMVCWEMWPAKGETPRAALLRLICMEQAVALDPLVSRDAQKLVERGRREVAMRDRTLLGLVREARDTFSMDPDAAPLGWMGRAEAALGGEPDAALRALDREAAPTAAMPRDVAEMHEGWERVLREGVRAGAEVSERRRVRHEMGLDPDAPPRPPNPWRETVRDIFDTLHFDADNVFTGSPLAARLVAMIEERHPEYFAAERKRDGRGRGDG